MTDDRDGRDAQFTDEILALLPTTPVPSALEARILSDFDRIAARRGRARLLQRWRDAVWPGAPLWKPATVLALSLAIGLTAGVLVPSSDFAGNDTASADQQYAAAGDTPPVVNMAEDL